MKDIVTSGYALPHSVGVAYVAGEDFDLAPDGRSNVRQPANLAPRIVINERSYVSAGGYQRFDKMAADKSVSPRNEDARSL
jgi:hypothetical protein